MGKNAIDFLIAFRSAVPDDGGGPDSLSDTWRKNPPLSVLRVRVPGSLGPVKRCGALTFVSREANSELGLKSDLQNLVDAVCESVTGKADLMSTDCVPLPPESSSMVDLVRDYGWAGPYCRDIGMDCQGDQ